MIETGKALEWLALQYGITRGPRLWYWPFKESDRSLRNRLLFRMRVK